jgi:hypothetical protein
MTLSKFEILGVLEGWSTKFAEDCVIPETEAEHGVCTHRVGPMGGEP